jgi:hypothetical protein
MYRLKFFLRSLAEAFCADGARALGGMAPFAEVFYPVTVRTLARLHEEYDEAGARLAVEEAAHAGPADARRLAEDVVRELTSDQPKVVRQALQAYLWHVPGVVRHVLRRPADMSGRTAPASLAVQLPEDLMPLLPGRVPRFLPGAKPRGAGDWQLVELLGVGGFGETWKVRHLDKPGEPPAALRLCTAPGALAFLRKVEDSALLPARDRHPVPGVVHLREIFLHADPPALRYDHVEGCDLAGLVHDAQPAPNPRRTEAMTRLVRRAAELAGVLHRFRPPVIHRGLKPRNVLLHRGEGGRFTVHLAELGAAAAASDHAVTASRLGKEARTDVLAASLRGGHMPLYASPEQMRDEAPDPQDDVHALGVIWYQLLVGDLAAAPTGPTWVADLKKAGVPDELVKLLMACVSPRVERRPADAAVLAEQMAALPAAPAA